MTTHRNFGLSSRQPLARNNTVGGPPGATQNTGANILSFPSAHSLRKPTGAASTPRPFIQDTRELAAWTFLGAFLGGIAFLFWLMMVGLSELI